jgi:hypothetical protein
MQHLLESATLHHSNTPSHSLKLPARDMHPRHLSPDRLGALPQPGKPLVPPLHTRARRPDRFVAWMPLPTLHSSVPDFSRQGMVRVQTSPHEDAQLHVSRVPFEVGPASPRLPSLYLICRSWRPIELEASTCPCMASSILPEQRRY